MKKLSLFALMTSCLLNANAQTNVWDGSTISTITTGGKVAIGTATPDANSKFTVLNTLNTTPNGIYNEITNTSTASEQYGIQNKITFNSATTGIKVGFAQNFSSASTSDNYGMILVTNSSAVGNRFGLVSTSFVNSAKTECAIYSVINPPGLGFPVVPAGDRSGYFLGAFEVVARASTEKVFMISQRTNFSVSGTGTDVFRVYGDGRVFATEINVKLAPFPDYVFRTDYKLMPLREVGLFIQNNGHLPNIPTADVIEKEGMNVGEMNRLLVEKIEELTMYMLEQQKEIDSLKQQISTIQHQ